MSCVVGTEDPRGAVLSCCSTPDISCLLEVESEGKARARVDFVGRARLRVDSVCRSRLRAADAWRWSLRVDSCKLEVKSKYS